MKNYPDHSPAGDESKDAPVMEFPVAPDYRSRPRIVDREAMFRRIEENMPWRNSRPGERERRLAEKIPVEFVL